MYSCEFPDVYVPTSSLPFPVKQVSIPLTKVLDWTETSSQSPFSFLTSVASLIVSIQIL